MAQERLLAEMGYVPKGMQPRNHPLEVLATQLDQIRDTLEEKRRKDLEKKQRRADLYRTLRNAGYSKDQAYDLSLKEGKMEKPEEEMTPTKKAPKPTRTENIEEDIKKAKKGEITWDEIKAKYPLNEDKVEEARKKTIPKIKRSPEFKFGTGGPISQIKSKISPNRAEINEKTISVIDQIENIEDLRELVDREEEARAKGIDINAILEYFNLTRGQIRKRNINVKTIKVIE